MANCQIQAEERLKRSVVLVQAMFMSKQAQENYRRMKLTHEEAQDKQVVISHHFYDGGKESSRVSWKRKSLTDDEVIIRNKVVKEIIEDTSTLQNRERFLILS